MKVSTMRWVDRWIGTGITATLSLWNRCVGRFLRRKASGLGSILFVKLAEQGSTVLAAPALARAVELVGRENVYFLVFEENRFILDVMEIVPEENVITIDAKGILGAMWGSLKAVRKMRRLRIDAAIDMEFFARSSAIFTYLSGAPMRAGFHGHSGEAPYRGALMSHELIYNPHFHTAQIFLNMVEALPQPAGRLPALDVVPTPLSEMTLPLLTPPVADVEEVSKLLTGLTKTDEVPPILLLNANCSDLLPLRRWDNDRYVELAKRLLEKYPRLHILFTGAPDEAPPVVALIDEIGSDRAASLAGKTTLRQLLVAYTLSDLLITNDSGPAHFAALTPADVITIFGPETPRLFAPPSPRSHVMWSGLACSPCVSAYNNRLSRCRDNVCVQKITVDMVFEKACEVLERRRGAGLHE